MSACYKILPLTISEQLSISCEYPTPAPEMTRRGRASLPMSSPGLLSHGKSAQIPQRASTISQGVPTCSPDQGVPISPSDLSPQLFSSEAAGDDHTNPMGDPPAQLSRQADATGYLNPALGERTTLTVETDQTSQLVRTSPTTPCDESPSEIHTTAMERL